MAKPSNQIEFSFSFVSDKNWKNHFLCRCGQEYFSKTEKPSVPARCTHCMTLNEPFVSDDGSLTKSQLQNLKKEVWLRRAFLGRDMGPRVFEDFIQQLYKTKFIVASSDVIYA
jgi:hypothetical protein